MTRPGKKEDHCAKWIPLLNAGQFREVLIEAEGKNIDSNKALDCIITLSKLAYNSRKGVTFVGSHDDFWSLTELFCSVISLNSSEKTSKIFTSLYHIVYFLFSINCLEHVISIFRIIVKIKQNNPIAYENDCETLHDPYIYILRMTIVKMVSNGNATVLHADVKTVFSLFVELLVRNKALVNGTLLLQVTLEVSRVACKQDQKAAVQLITFCLGLFYKIDQIEDTDSCLPLLYKIYTNLFITQLKISPIRTALSTVEVHLNKAKWKYSLNNVLHAECFVLVCNVIKVLTCDGSELSMLKKIQDNNKTLSSFQNLSDNPCVKAACVFMLTLMENSLRTFKESNVVFPQSCLIQLVEMLLKLSSILKDCREAKTILIQTICEVFNNETHRTVHLDEDNLEEFVGTIIRGEECLIELLQEVRSFHDNADVYTKLVLIRCANLIRRYYLDKFYEAVITISKPICKFIISLPLDVFGDDQNQASADMCFSFQAYALNMSHPDKALETLVVYLMKFPQMARKVFQIWGDLKHNTVCEGKEDHLEMTIWAIITDKKSILEKEWLPCNWNNAEIGNFLVEEMKIYFVNKALRGKPVLAAAEALLALPTDCLTQVKGLVIAIDIVTANTTYPDQCLAFYNKSKSLATKLRKEKKRVDPVDFNCCMGDLLYAQMRCDLRYLRMDSESDFVRMSIMPREPLISLPPESRPDPNDTCDVTTKYNNLCLSKQRKLMENLDSALRHWEFALSMLKEMSNVEYDLRITLVFLRDAGFLLNLYCDEMKQMKVWQLLYDMATITGDAEMVVTAVGEMMDFKEYLDNKCWHNPEQVLSMPSLSEKCKRIYQIKNALFNLNQNKINEGLNLLDVVEKDPQKSSLQLTEFLTIIGKYQRLNDWKKYKHTFSSSPTYHFSFHKALAYLLFFVGENKWGNFSEACQVHSQLLHVSRLVGEDHWCLEQPRVARCYLRPQLLLAQKLALPLRTVQLLLLLAWVDLSTGVTDDCVAKLESVEDLLELCGTPVVYGQSDSPRPIHFNKGVLSEPEYLSHPTACHCLPCTTLEYRRLVLETVTLRATFCANHGRIEDSLQCFEVAMRVHDNLCGSNNKEVQQSCGRMWMRHADTMALLLKYQEALISNTKALKLLSNVQESISFQYVIEQRLSIEVWLHQLPYAPSGAKPIPEVETSPQSTLKTPPSKVRPKYLPPGKSPLCIINDNITPFALPVRKFKLPASGAENTPVSSPKTRRKKKVLPGSVNETPQTGRKKTSRAPFVIVDDDGNAVSVSSSKPRSEMKKTTTTNVNKSSSTKNKLFSSNNALSGVKSGSDLNINDVDDTTIRQSSRKNIVKTYGNAKTCLQRYPKSNGTDKGTQKKEPHGCNDVFVCEKMKIAINEIKTIGVLPKNSNSKDDIGIDCDIIQGTPPEPPKKTFTGRKCKQTSRTK